MTNDIDSFMKIMAEEVTKLYREIDKIKLALRALVMAIGIEESAMDIAINEVLKEEELTKGFEKRWKEFFFKK